MAGRPGELLIADALAEMMSSRRDAPARASVPILRQVPLFAELPDRHLRRVARLAVISRFRAGTAIVRKGSRGSAFYVILEGTVRVVRRGRPSTILGAGESFGEMALLDHGPRSATVTAETAMTALRIFSAPFDKLLRTEPRIALALLHTLSTRVRELEDSL